MKVVEVVLKLIIDVFEVDGLQLQQRLCFDLNFTIHQIHQNKSSLPVNISTLIQELLSASVISVWLQIQFFLIWLWIFYFRYCVLFYLVADTWMYM